MKNALSFDVPFSGFCGTTFINCFSSVYLFLKGITGSKDYPCAKRDGKACDGCGNCSDSANNVQERHFFIFDTMCGHSALRCRFDDRPTEMHNLICERDYYDGGTDNNIDFLFGFAGYEYRKAIDPAAYRTDIAASIDAGRPVIAKLKAGADCFRVITGYDEDVLLEPNYANAQRPPEGALRCDELDALYIVGEEIAPRYTLRDGLARIKTVMEYNAREKLWDEYIDKTGWYGHCGGDGMSKCDPAERRARMQRVTETMWHTFNTHNFAEVFRHCYYEELRDPALAQLWKPIGGPLYGYTHDLAWALIDLGAHLNWSELAYPCGTFEMAQLTLQKIRENDAGVLDIINRALEIIDRREG